VCVCVCMCMCVRVCTYMCVFCSRHATLHGKSRIHVHRRQKREPSVGAPIHAHMFTLAHPRVRAHARTHARTHTLSLTHTCTRARTISLSPSFVLSLALALSHAHLLPPSLHGIARHSDMADLLADGSGCLGARAGALGRNKIPRNQIYTQFTQQKPNLEAN